MKTLLSVLSVMFCLSGCYMFSQHCDTLSSGSTDTVYFDYDSSKLTKDAIDVLNVKVSEFKFADGEIVVEGHADERGTREYNLGLGERRADAVKRYFVSQGIAEGRIEVISYGKERPAVIGHDESAWAKNRRAISYRK